MGSERNMKIKDKFTPDIFKSGKITLYNMDCLWGMRNLIKPDSVDVVITSPPYNIGTVYNEYNDKIIREEYLDWCENWLITISCRILSENGSFFLNISGKPSNQMLPFEILKIIDDQKLFKLQNVIHWVKSIAIGKDTIGHYKPINSNRYLNDCHEYIFHFTKTGKVELDRLSIGVPYKDKSNIKRWKGVKEDKRCRGNVWLIPYKTIQSSKDDRPHPASFPITLPDMCIRLHGLERTKLVLDPFLGIGSTAIAAMKLKKKFIGFEIDKEYFKESCNSIKKLEEDNV